MQKRDSWIDCLKAFGMILVFHGHVIEIAFGDQRSGALYHQFQYIYSFHIPLFFFLSGYVAKAPSGTFSRFIRGKFFTLVVPASFFVLLMTGLQFVYDLLTNSGAQMVHYIQMLLSPLGGFPKTAWPAWFLFCLFSAHVLFWITYPLYARMKWVFLPALFIVGAASVAKIDLVSEILHIQNNFWFINNAPMACFFLYFGHTLKTYQVHPSAMPTLTKVVLAVALLPLAYWLAPFNSGPFLRDKEAVILAIAQIGDPLWFLLSAGLGIASLGLFVDLVKKSGWIARIGELSLPLLFFASVFFHIINVRLIVLFYSYVQAYPVLVTIGITLLSLAISIPMAIVMQKLAPQLLGAPAARGPILPPLVKG